MTMTELEQRCVDAGREARNRAMFTNDDISMSNIVRAVLAEAGVAEMQQTIDAQAAMIAEKDRWLRCVADDLREAFEDWTANGCDAKDAIRLVLNVSVVARLALNAAGAA